MPLHRTRKRTIISLLFFSIPGIAQLQSISFSPNPVTGGNNTIGTACLSFSAHSQTILVGVNNYHPAVTSPTTNSSISIPPFQQCAQFTATTRDVQFDTPGQFGIFWFPKSHCFGLYYPGC
jgi:hypothetical protein